MISIKHRFSEAEIYRFDGDSLRGADFREANLRLADLQWADLRRADLSEAILEGAYLRGANLCEANLRAANLQWADLREADLRGADLHGANLRYVDLQYVNLIDTKGIVYLGTDPRGYRFVGVQHDDGWRISAGCRWFTIDEAKIHWANNSDALARINILSEKTI
jgi:uncharacterized protein YjbI with pentapeptide repeats